MPRTLSHLVILTIYYLRSLSSLIPCSNSPPTGTASERHFDAGDFNRVDLFIGRYLLMNLVVSNAFAANSLLCLLCLSGIFGEFLNSKSPGTSSIFLLSSRIPILFCYSYVLLRE